MKVGGAIVLEPHPGPALHMCSALPEAPVFMPKTNLDSPLWMSSDLHPVTMIFQNILFDVPYQ